MNLLSESDWKGLFAEDSIDALLAEHVWEHLSVEEGRRAAQFCYHYLQPGGYLRTAVPDGLHPSPEYLQWVRPNGSGPGADDHRVLYTATSFGELFEHVGFNVVWLEYFDEKKQFHFCDWKPEDGMVRRSRRFDPRNQNGKLQYTSLILDARKPDGPPSI
ncbi:MAG: SAM-dependent methyltransferase [Planctomycetes bacterium]|nr:SAM-dependent methyltransferase [Planctomycetota bacterium]